MKKMFIMAGLVFIFGYAANYVYCAPANLANTKQAKEYTQRTIKQAEKDIEQAPIKAVLGQIQDKLKNGVPPETIIADIRDILKANPDIKEMLFKKWWNYGKFVDIIVDAGNDYASVIGYIAGIIDLNDSNYWGWGHPLCHAALKGYDKVVEELLKYIDPNVKDNGDTALHLAAYNGHYKVVEKLLKYIDPNVKDNDNWTALHLTTYEEHTSIIDMLLNHPKTKLNAKNKFHQTALHFAAMWGHYKAVKLLLIYGVETDGLNERHKKFVNKVLRDMNIDRERKDKFNELISEQRYVGALRIFSLIERKTQNEIFKNLGIKHRERLEKQLGYLFNSEILPFFTPSAAASEVQEEVIE